MDEGYLGSQRLHLHRLHEPSLRVPDIFGEGPPEHVERSHACELTTELQALRIGDTGVIGLPGEPFSNLGIEARERSKAKKTFYVGYANDGIGYIPTMEAFTECEHIGFEEGFGHTICYGAALPSSVISKESITKLTSAGIDLVNSVAS